MTLEDLARSESAFTTFGTSDRNVFGAEVEVAPLCPFKSAHLVAQPAPAVSRTRSPMETRERHARKAPSAAAMLKAKRLSAASVHRCSRQGCA